MDCDIGAFREFEALPHRQRVVLDLVARHHTTKEIAKKLKLSPHTVEQRIQALRTKFGEVPRRELGRIYAELENAYVVSRSNSRTATERRLPEAVQVEGDPKRSGHNSTFGGWTFLSGLLVGLLIGLGVALIAVVATYMILTDYMGTIYMFNPNSAQCY